MKPTEIHERAREVIRGFSKEVRIEFGSAPIKAQLGMTLGFPISRPMPSVLAGAHEMRFRDASGIHRVFYYLKRERSILVFHAFTKKTQQTPSTEIATGRKRLKEMLSDEKA